MTRKNGISGGICGGISGVLVCCWCFFLLVCDCFGIWFRYFVSVWGFWIFWWYFVANFRLGYLDSLKRLLAVAGRVRSFCLGESDSGADSARGNNNLCVMGGSDECDHSKRSKGPCGKSMTELTVEMLNHWTIQRNANISKSMMAASVTAAKWRMAPTHMPGSRKMLRAI